MNLKQALEKLEAFTKQQEERTFPHLFAPESSLLQKTFKLLQVTLSDRFRIRHQEKEAAVKKDIEHAVRVVKSHHILLENYKTGSLEQQAVTERASDLFKRYNALVDISKHPPDSWKTRIAHLYCKVSGISIGLELHKIELPPPALIASRLPKLKTIEGTLSTHRFRRHEHPSQSEAKTDAIFHKEGFPHPLTKRESDAFRGKVFSLLHAHCISFASRLEEVSMVQLAPLRFSQKGDLVSVETTLYPYPGEEVKIQGIFQRQPEALVPSIPLADQFTLKHQNIQTGFPYPAQHHGGITWAEQLLPDLPHHPQEIPQIVKLFEKKQQIALNFHEDRDFLKNAKKRLAEKREAICTQLDHYLALQKQLCNALLTASEEENSRESIDDFIVFLQKQSAPFDYLADTHQIIVENLLTRPYTHFQKERFSSKNQKIWTQEEVHAFLKEETKQIFDELLLQKGDSITLKYIRMMGSIMIPAAHTIILQHLSESLEFAPPMLNPFAQKVQTVLYEQLSNFLSEEKNEVVSWEDMIIKETEIYLEEEIESDWVTELEGYFNTRYYEHLARKK